MMKSKIIKLIIFLWEQSEYLKERHRSVIQKEKSKNIWSSQFKHLNVLKGEVFDKSITKRFFNP